MRHNLRMLERSPNLPSDLAFLQGGGEMGARMRSLDWSKTPLGPPETWPQSLRSTVSMLLPSRAQIILFWGPEFTVLYNDAYRPVFGAKHPQALGLPGREAWSEIWASVLHDLLAGVVRTGEAFWGKDLLFELERYGFLEETYFDVSYDPVRGESGEVEGVYCIVTETTERVIGERRMALLKDLAERNTTARTERDACVIAIDTLAAKPQDVTFALAYLDGKLQCFTPGAEEQLAAAQARAGEGLHDRILQSAGADRAAGGRPQSAPAAGTTDTARSWTLVADQLGTALVNARAYEDERHARRSAGAARSREDRVLQQRQPRVPHAAHADARADRGSAGLPERALSGEALEIGASQRAAPAQTGQHAAGFLPHRGRTRRRRATSRPISPTLTADLASTFRSAIERAGLDFVVDCPPLSQPVYVDREMWEKIVLNLLSNALKFTLDGSVHRVARTSTRARSSCACAIPASAFPTPRLPHVFERFHRVQGARGRTHEGSGIGLALVSELVKMHGGTIERREQGWHAGTTFTVTHPDRRRASAGERVTRRRTLEHRAAPARRLYVTEALRWIPDSGAASRSEGSGRAGGLVGETRRIILADDNADMREYVRRLLSDRWSVEAVAARASGARGRADVTRRRWSSPT